MSRIPILLRTGKVIAILAVCAIGAAGLYTAACSYLLGKPTTKAFERTVGPLDLSSYALPEVPDGENRAHGFKQAAATLDLDKEEKQAVRDAADHALPMNAYRIASAQPLIAQYQKALQIAWRASERSSSSYAIDYETGARLEPPPVVELMNLANLLTADARLSQHEGRYTETLRSIRALGALAESLQSENFLIAFLMGLATERMQIESIRFLIQKEGPGADDYSALLETLGKNELRERLLRIFGFEGAEMYHLNRETVQTAPDSPGGRLRREGLEAIGTLISSAMAGNILWDLNFCAEMLEMDYPTMTRHVSWSFRGWVSKLPRFDIRRDLGHCPNLIAQTNGVISQRSLARVALELRQEKLEGGAYPGQLEREGASLTAGAFAGGNLSIDIQADGSAILSLPEAVKLCRTLPNTWALAFCRGPDRYSYVLP